jgi:hypothetical protein
MGMFDSLWVKNNQGKEIEIQFKAGDCMLEVYKIGSTLILPNGIYYAPEGAFVVFNNVVVAGFDSEDDCFFDKHGYSIEYPNTRRIDKYANQRKG